MRKFLALLALTLAILACNFPTTTVGEPTVFVEAPQVEDGTPIGAQEPAPTLPPTRDPNIPISSPTPDAPHGQPTLRSDYIEYAVQPSDILTSIADRFGVSLEELIAANNITIPGSGFGTETNKVTLLQEDSVDELPLMSKYEVANRILDRVLDLLKTDHP